MAKGVTVRDVCTCPELEICGTDHVLVTSIVEDDGSTGCRSLWARGRIPSELLDNPIVMGRAAKFYENGFDAAVKAVKEAPDGAGLERATNMFEEALLKPTQAFCRTDAVVRSGRFCEGWDKVLDHLAKKREKLQRARARAVGRGKAIGELDLQIVKLCNEIRNRVRTGRRRTRRRLLERLEASEQTVGPTNMAFALRRDQTLLLVDRLEQKRPLVDAEIYRKWVVINQTHDVGIEACGMDVPEGLQFLSKVEAAIDRAGRGKAPGLDGVCVELMKLGKQGCERFLYELWMVWGRLKYVPNRFREGVLVPVYKVHEDPVAAKSYRPIMLFFSHVQDSFDVCGCECVQVVRISSVTAGFCQKVGTELATLRLLAAIRSGHRFVAVLDLKRAYPSVRRKMLLQICRERLPKDVADMV